MITAMVILTAASGQSLPLDRAVTAANIPLYRPDPRVAAEVAERMKRAGLEVGPMVGVAFSVTGDTELFEKIFKHQIRVDDHGEMMFETREGPSQDLPALALPAELRPGVEGLVFTPVYEIDP